MQVGLIAALEELTKRGALALLRSRYSTPSSVSPVLIFIVIDFFFKSLRRQIACFTLADMRLSCKILIYCPPLTILRLRVLGVLALGFYLLTPVVIIQARVITAFLVA